MAGWRSGMMALGLVAGLALPTFAQTTPEPMSPRACLADYGALNGLMAVAEDENNRVFWEKQAMDLAPNARSAGALPGNYFDGDNSPFIQDMTKIQEAFFGGTLSAEVLIGRAAACLEKYPGGRVSASQVSSAPRPAPAPAAPRRLSNYNDQQCAIGVIAIARMYNQMSVGALILDNDEAKQERLMQKQYVHERQGHEMLKKAGTAGLPARYVPDETEWPEPIEQAVRAEVLAIRDGDERTGLGKINEVEACLKDRGYPPLNLNFN